MRAVCYGRASDEVLPDARALYAEVGEQRDAVAVLAGNVFAYTLYQSRQPEEALRIALRTAAAAEAHASTGSLLPPAQHPLMRARPRSRSPCRRRTLRIAEQHDQRRVAAAASNLAGGLASIGNYRDAAEQARQAVVAAERTAERFFERYARLALGRALCSLGKWDRAVAEIESVKENVPPVYVGMAIAPLVVSALARGQTQRVREFVAEYDERSTGGDTRAFESDFRILRAAALASLSPDGNPEISRLIPQAGASDYAEWTDGSPRSRSPRCAT